MPMHQFSDDCPGCRPAMINLTTNEVLPEDDPMMQKMLSIWGATSYEERQAYHRVMCQNSRAITDLLIVQAIVNKLK